MKNQAGHYVEGKSGGVGAMDGDDRLASRASARLRAAGCVFAEDEARLLISEARTAAELETMVDLRATGLPLEQVVGWAEFCGLRIAVDRGVFVPRPRTELLVRHAVELALIPARGLSGPRILVDLCCGSGAVGAALVAALDAVELHAADVDPAAVRCARRNLAATGARVYAGDLFDALPARLHGRVELLVANVPYVPTEAIELLPQEARVHEPRLALDGGPDGLDVQRRVAAAAPQWLASGGRLLFETSRAQAPLAADTLTRHGMTARVTSSDELDTAVVAGTLAA